MDYEIKWVGNVKIVYVKKNPFCALVQKHKTSIENIWNEQRRQRPHLTNGAPLFLVNSNVRNGVLRINVCVGEYKHWLAQYENSELNFGIKPIGIYGITVLKKTQEVLFARRSNQVTQHQGFLGLVPSGGLDKSLIRSDKTVDFKRRLLEEFTEETKVGADCVAGMKNFALALDAKDGVYSFSCVVTINATRGELRAGFARSTEYEKEPIFVPIKELQKFVFEHKHELTPPSIAFSLLFASTQLQAL